MSTVSDARQMVVAPQYAMGASAMAGSPAQQDTGINAGDLWRVVKQRKLLIFIVFCLLYVAVVASTVLVYKYAPLYSSDAYIRLIPPTKGMVSEETFVPRDYILHQLATEAARIKDPDLLLEVLRLPEVKATKYYNWFGDKFEDCLADFEKRLGVAPVRDTYLIRVSLAVQDKAEARLIVEHVCDRYLRRSRSNVESQGNERLEELRRRQTEVEGKLIEKRAQIATARSQRDVADLEQDRAVQAEQVSMLSNTIAELKTRKADVQAQLDTTQGVDPRNLPVSAEMRVIIEADPLLRYYRNQVEQLNIEIEVGRRNNYGDKHKVMRALKDRYNRYYEMEASRREELTDDLRARQLEQLNQEMARVERMMTTIREQLAEREATQRDLDQTIQMLKGWEKDELLMQGELEQIGRALLEAETRVGVQKKEGRLKLAIAPRESPHPSRPSFKVWLGGGMLLSLMAAVGLAFLREFTDKAIRTPVDVARHGHVPVLGCVPLLDDEEADIDEMEYATRQAPQSLVAEAFRQVRAHLTFSGPLDSQQTLLVTSPRPEDGKTAVAVNMAVTFAQANEKTLLIDCNFRRPGVRRLFPDTKAEGLSNVLAGHTKVENVICATEVGNLSVLNSGPMPPNPAELLGAPAMETLLKEARGKFDRVVLDGPPCLLISDSLVLATRVDAVVLVARAVHGTKGTLKRAREQLQRTNARVIGAVLNGVEARPGGYFREQYREFYDYTEEEVVLRELPPAGPPEIGDTSSADENDKRDD